MSPSEELRFDFEVAIEVAKPPSKRRSRVADDVCEETPPSTDELLARIAKVQAVASRRDEAVIDDERRPEITGLDGSRAGNWHPSRGSHLTSLTTEIDLSS